MTAATTLDLHYAGRRGLISAFLVPTGDGGFVLLDTGPTSTVDTLEREIETAGYAPGALRAVLLTHIHLDHAAAAGTLARRSGCEVRVHPDGITHLGNPESKLLPSARRLYGDRLEPLFGVMEGVPDGLLQPVVHGEPVQIGNLSVIGWHTPGHARHHVAWQVGDSVATGDVAGVRLEGTSYVLPPMPPPDIDVESWLASIDLLRRLDPAHLLLTHFGSVDDPRQHLEQLVARLRRWSELTRDVVGEGGGVDELVGRLLELDDGDMAAARLPDDLRTRYRALCPTEENAAGLHRWGTKRSKG